MKNSFHRLIDYQILLFVVLIGAVIYPFLALFLFTHPQVDDFCWAVSFRQPGITNFVRSFFDWYQGFTGRYSYIVLMGIFSNVSDITKHYEILPLSIVIVWLASSCFLLKTVFDRASFIVVATGTMALFSLYILTMPEVADFYWMSSSAQYQFGNALAITAVTCMLRLSIAERPRLYAITVALLLFVVVGTTEMYMLFMVVLLIAITVFVLVTGQRHRLIWSMLLAVTILSAALLIFAPGNEERGQHLIARHQFLYSLTAATFQTGLWMLRWIWEPLLWITTLIYVTWLARHSPKSRLLEKIRRIHMVIVTPCWLVTLFGCFFAGFWAMGDIIPPRALNVVYFIFLIGWFASVTVIITNIQQSHGNFLNVLGNSGVGHAISVLVAIAMIVSMFNAHRFSTAHADLKNRAHRYDEIHDDRYKKLLEAKENNLNQVVEVPQISESDRPKTVYFMDIGDEWNGFPNPCCAEFFGVVGIATVKN